MCRLKRDHKIKVQSHLWENKREAVSTEPGVLKDPEQTYKFKNCATKWSKKQQWGYPQKYRVASESLAGLMKSIFLPNAIYKIVGGDCYFEQKAMHNFKEYAKSG